MNRIRAALLFICFLNSLNLIAQQETLKLKLDNYEPRVGENVKLSFDFEFFTKSFEQQLNPNIIIVDNLSLMGLNESEFSKTIKFPKAGNTTVGPFKFNINGKDYVTDSISLRVLDKLPFKEGFWCRLVTDNHGNKFLILEQYTQNEITYTKTKDGFSVSEKVKKGAPSDPVEIVKIQEKGIEINFAYSSSSTVHPDDFDFSKPGMSYSIKKYQIVFDEDFSGSFTLSVNHLKNLPKQFSFDDILITR